MATVSRENEALLIDIIKVEIAKNDYYPKFENALKKYSAQAKISGFRPGMVPIGVVKKMYGRSVFVEEVLRTVETEINGYLEQEKPDIFGQPLPIEDNNDTLERMDMNNPGNYTFKFEIGLKPSFEIPGISTASFTRRQVNVSNEMVNDEVKRIQKEYGELKDAETIEDSNDVVAKLTFFNVDTEGNESIESFANKIPVNLSSFSAAVRSQFVGLKIGDTLTVDMDSAFLNEEKPIVFKKLNIGDSETAGACKIVVDEISITVPAVLDATFFEKVFPNQNLETAEAFTEALKIDLEKFWKSQTSNQIHDEIYHYLIDNTQIEFPASFLKRWIKTGGKDIRTDDEVEKEYPAFINSLRWNLISSSIIQENGLDVEPEELKVHTKQQLMGYMRLPAGNEEEHAWIDAYVDRQLQDKEYVEKTYQNILSGKLLSLLESQVVNYKDELVSVEEFTSKAQRHY